MEHKLMINSIDNGTTIDHIPAGKALEIIKFLKINPKAAIAIAINVPSNKMGTKDLIFIENFELSKREMKKIGLMARNVTVNIVKNKKLVKKHILGLPEEAEGIIKCLNPNCISNKENIPSKFSIHSSTITGTCHYCEKNMTEQEMINSLK